MHAIADRAEQSLAELRSEDSVRAVLTDFNARVRQDRLRPTEGRMPRVLAPTVDVDDLVEQWRALSRELPGSVGDPERAQSPAAKSPTAPKPPASKPQLRLRRWWRGRRHSGADV